MIKEETVKALQDMKEQNENLLESETFKILEKEFPKMYDDLVEGIITFNNHIKDILKTYKLTPDPTMLVKLKTVTEEGKVCSNMVRLAIHVINNKNIENKVYGDDKNGQTRTN